LNVFCVQAFEAYLQDVNGIRMDSGMYHLYVYISLTDFQVCLQTDATDISRLGDCWFLSSLAAMAEFQGGRLVQRRLPQSSY